MDVIDQALEMLEECGPEFGENGLSNHGPMAAEALSALGRGEEVEGWVARYRKRLDVRPPAVERIRGDSWRAALGDPNRVTDWESFFGNELESGPWRDVLERWVVRLAPGVMAGATHGLIRTAHAVRSLSAEEMSVERKAELAAGLGYWAARYQRLPGMPSPVPPRLPSEALEDVPVLPVELRDHRSVNIFRAVAELDDFQPFTGAMNLAAPGDDLSTFLSDLTRTMASLYLQNAGKASISYVHSVTAPSAVRMIIPHVTPTTARVAARYAWQAAAAIHSRYHMPREVVVPAAIPPAADLIDQAVYSGDEHAIKFTEACLREYALTPDPVYLIGSLDMSERYGAKRLNGEHENR